jgi:hypothetical protein
MRSDCLDVGTIQAFLDGETEPTASLKVANHISECEACSAMLAEAEEESAMVFPMLEREFNTLVPTQRLWTKINDEIEFEKQNQPFWRKIWMSIAVAASSPSLVVAASVLIVLGLFVAFWGGHPQQPLSGTQVAYVPDTKIAQPIQNPPDSPIITGANSDSSNLPTPAKAAPQHNEERYEVERADYREPARSRINRSGSIAPSAPTYEYLPGEESYVKTIATLNQSVAGQKDVVMRPSERVDFERDLAVVNDSIQKMRQEVRKNPKNESAKQVLYASYQNKIDLLSSVNEKEELLALK